MALDRTASRFLVPIGALLALGVAVGVWLVPSSVLDPQPPNVADIRTPVPPAPRAPMQTLPERSIWMGAAQKLETRREPDPVEDELDTPPVTPGDEPRGEVEGAPRPESPRFRLNWEYEGMVSDPKRNAALIRISNMQRFAFEGETFDRTDDPSIPAGSEVVLERVERDRIILRIDGVEQEIERVDLSTPTRAPAPAPGSPTSRRRS